MQIMGETNRRLPSIAAIGRLLRPPRQPTVRFAGRNWTYEQICRHWLFLGGTGRGKTFASDYLIQEMMKLGGPMVFTVVKPTDYERIHECAVKAGHASRVVRVHPGGECRINMMEALFKGHGSPYTAAQLLAKVSAVGNDGRGGGENEAFWETQKVRALQSGIVICLEVTGKVALPDLYAVITHAPGTPEEAKRPQWNVGADFDQDGQRIYRNRSAELIVQGFRQGLYESSTAFKNATNYLMSELCGGGDRMRGGVIAGVNNAIGPFLNEPFLSALDGPTTMCAATADEENLIVVCDYPMMEHHSPARKFQFVWTLDTQLHCMRRRYDRSTPPFILVRDECGWVLNGSWDQQVAIVSRSQGLGTVDIVQDISTLLSALGGDSARNEVMSFISNHANLLCFGSSSNETNQYASQLVGDHIEVMTNGGGGHQPDKPAGNALDGFLGAGGDVRWSTSWAPRIRPEAFARLPVGVGILISDGDVTTADFRKGNY